MSDMQKIGCRYDTDGDGYDKGRRVYDATEE